MKHTLLVFFYLITSSLCFAQAKKEWKQMQDFHEIISKTYHPSEEGNLQPAKDKVDSLVLSAKAWQTSAIPADYNSKLIKPTLNKLVIECQALKQAVIQKKDDSTLKKLIALVHTTFHTIMEKSESSQ